MAVLDRVAGPFAAMARALTARVDYCAYYRARVVAQSSDLATVDVQPDSANLPGLSGIPLKPPLPGAIVAVQTGAFVMVGYENGDATRPYAIPCWDAGATLTKLILNGQLVEIGGESGAQKMLLAETLVADLQTFVSTLNTILQSGTAGGPTKQVIVQAAQLLTTQLYTRLQSGGTAYLSTVVKNK